MPVKTELLEVDVDLLEPGRFQPRQIFSEVAINELSVSIQAQGVVQPILARPLANGRFEIVAGERRWRAAQHAGMQKIPTVVREMDDAQAIKAGLVENLQRESLRPIEEAKAISKLVKEFGLTHELAARELGRSREEITHTLRLLNIAQDVQDQIDNDPSVSMGHAKIIAGLEHSDQRTCIRLVRDNGWSVRQLEKHCRARRKGEGDAAKDPDVRHLEDEISEILGAPTSVRHTKNGSGDLVIHYHSLDELDGILEHMRVPKD